MRTCTESHPVTLPSFRKSLYKELLNNSRKRPGDRRQSQYWEIFWNSNSLLPMYYHFLSSFLNVTSQNDNNRQKKEGKKKKRKLKKGRRSFHLHDTVQSPSSPSKSEMFGHALKHEDVFVLCVFLNKKIIWGEKKWIFFKKKERRDRNRRAVTVVRSQHDPQHKSS